MDKRDVFISYHTESAKDRVIQICKALENVGVSCWYAPRDVSGLYAGAIERAIDECKVFLLVLNEEANHSQHVLNEVDSAFDRLNRQEQIELLPFLVGHCQLTPDMRYYIRRIHMMDGTNPPDELRTRELVDRICRKLGKNPEKAILLDNENSQQAYRITGQMMYPDTHFVGRSEELKAIRDQLSGVTNKVLLVGMGGIGKSEIAKMYLRENAESHDVLLWVSFEGSLQSTIASDYRFPIQGMSHTDYPEDDERTYFKRKLQLLKQIADRRVLIVMDNFDVTGDPDLEDFCGGSYSVIFTTRYHQSGMDLPVVEVQGMPSPEQMMDLFRAEYHRPLQGDDLRCVGKILDHLEGHPLSIRLVASAMQKNRRLRPEEMLQMLKTGAAYGEKQSAKGSGTIGGYLQQVFRVSSLTEDEQYLLKNLALIPLQGIEVELFYDWCNLDDFDVVDGLIEKSWVIHDPVADKIHLHPLVAELMLEELKKDPDCCNALVDSIYKSCHIDVSCTWRYKVWLNEIAGTLYARLPKGHPKYALALYAKARLTISMAHYEEGTSLMRQVLPLAKTLEEKLEYYHRLAHVLNLSGFGAEGIKVAEEGVCQVENIPLDRLTKLEGHWLCGLYSRISEAYVSLGKYEQAVTYARLAKDTQGNRFYETNLEDSKGWKEYHLARALLYAGRYTEAEQVIREAIERFERINSMWSVNYAYDLLGQILITRGCFEEALALNNRAAQILAPHYGTEHVDIAANLERRGNIFAAMGQKEKADGLYWQAAQIYLKCNCCKLADKVKKKM